MHLPSFTQQASKQRVPKRTPVCLRPLLRSFVNKHFLVSPVFVEHWYRWNDRALELNSAVLTTSQSRPKANSLCQFRIGDDPGKLLECTGRPVKVFFHVDLSVIPSRNGATYFASIHPHHGKKQQDYFF